ncbi:IS110 family RNA-guided transposase [Spelaeicoccus albus]|uniref:Transposase n=1 Tax=Spelaeicoccus albus TaxID=1280376 RepID=A0A7Z0D266_9MICO|nr:IS110 family transposase [Spelaeicoccus albus]NYI66260.1 transposase [Spelaeicoccus albus]NYI67436.1 transposase [Spelaeicoccus albus]NYI67496.1 transposase [Spelaeicoccus albus]NYI69211.1 transposase [Spelaeicoccus albus]
MTIVADTYDHVIGVDTHARTHTYALVNARTGGIEKTKTFPTHPAGLARALTWISQVTGTVLIACEGTGSYGRQLALLLADAGLQVTEVRPPAKTSRVGTGKTDNIDARTAARGILGTDTDQLITPRAPGARHALAVLLAARLRLDAHRTRLKNSLTALCRDTNLGIDARTGITNAQITTIAAWRTRTTDDLDTTTCRDEARRIAKEIHHLTAELAANRERLATIITDTTPALLDINGVGPINGAKILNAYSHHGRIRTEAAFAKLAGTAPLPASSGNTTRHRLSRYGDRQLNSALHRIAMTRLAHDPATQAYRDKRTTHDASNRDIHRSLKRYIAREIYRNLEHITA